MTFFKFQLNKLLPLSELDELHSPYSLSTFFFSFSDEITKKQFYINYNGL